MGEPLIRVLVAHNPYQQRGGEDSVVEAEVALLRNNGHVVELYARHNDELAAMGRVHAACDAVWSARTAREIGELVREFRPDVIHVHNSFPLISPSLYWEAACAGVPVVQSLHNFRLLCPQAMLLRQGNVCEDCIGRIPWRGVLRRCYRDSAAQSAVLAGMLMLHRLLGTWKNKVTRYIAFNELCRAKFIEGGLPPERIAVKPNFVDLSPPADDRLRAGFLFVGRLSNEKGISVLARALTQFPECRVEVVGSGPAEALIANVGNACVVGWRDRDYVMCRMQASLALVMPSVGYETFGLAALEAFACGLPVIGSRLGAIAELVRDGETGLLFEAGNAEDLTEKLRWAASHPQALRNMGISARAEYERKYSPEINYRQLMAIYDDAIAEVRGGGR